MIKASPDSHLRARILASRPLPGVRAGSAVVWHDRRLLVIQDDAFSVVWVDPASGEMSRATLAGSGEELPKARKPDFEAAFVGPGRAVTVLGSGSAERRRHKASVDLDSGRVHVTDLGALFDAVEARIGVRPNVEGAVLAGEVLRLFHRGAGPRASAIVDVVGSVLEGRAVEVLGHAFYDLGFAGGVPLHFTDAAVFGGRTLYLAVAEGTPNAIDDGPVVGAAVGILAGDQARYAMLEEPSGEGSCRKVEGITFDPERKTIWAVTDPDDPERPAELCVIALEGFF
ncbi:hypothetical protein [Polyangium sp. y55x31]|uniref:DUF6929 family protein n=1 Tax=Polyangium sp. y55x31 TaxID=3042688 RepID=UPI00248283FF|nr:hypothetical protein [Polyangium sp. y55x31]MDI1482331.1 hypothetical protein [Polyangium sp. y55x31]